MGDETKSEKDKTTPEHEAMQRQAQEDFDERVWGGQAPPPVQGKPIDKKKVLSDEEAKRLFEEDK